MTIDYIFARSLPRGAVAFFDCRTGSTCAVMLALVGRWCCVGVVGKSKKNAPRWRLYYTDKAGLEYYGKLTLSLSERG